jgi:integrase
MGKQLRNFEGRIDAVSQPRFAADRNVWVLMVKENGKWIAVVSRNEEKIKAHYDLLEAKRIAQTINTSVQATSLSASKVRTAEYAFSVLEKHSVDDEALVRAAELFAKQQPVLSSPLLSDCSSKFLLKQKKRNLSSATYNDYTYLLKELCHDFDGKRIGEITPTMWTAFIEKRKHPVTQRARFIYLKSFLNFCAGKNNPEATEQKWIDRVPLYWEMPKTEVQEIVSYSFDEVVDLLKRAKTNGTLGFFVMRLFSMMRTHEYRRFIELGGQTVGTNRFIDVESGRITINNFVYRKRGQSENRGRYYNELPSAFKEWLEYFKAEGTSLWVKPKVVTKMLKKSKNPKDRSHNILRHTAITFHALRFSDPLRTSYIAGNSVGIVTNHYLNMNIPKTDAESFYDLTPIKAKELGIL